MPKKSLLKNRSVTIKPITVRVKELYDFPKLKVNLIAQLVHELANYGVKVQH